MLTRLNIFFKVSENINALLNYAEKQVKQLNNLIQLIQSTLSKGYRTCIIFCITMSTHASDVVTKTI